MRCIVMCVALLACQGQTKVLTDATGTDSPSDASAVDCEDLASLLDLPEQIVANPVASATYPIVLAHGAFGFDQVGPVGYWGGIPQALRDAGFSVYVTAVSPFGSTIDSRGPELARQIECIARQTGTTAMHIIGHSQGGLDARWVAAAGLSSHRVVTITTIGTPHKGTYVSDVSAGLVPGIADNTVDVLANAMATLLGAPNADESVRQLIEATSETAMAKFNLLYPNAADVRYFSWSGRAVRTPLNTTTHDSECQGQVTNPGTRDIIAPSLYPTFEFLSQTRGPNDGIVTIESAKWGTFMGCIPADHLDEIGFLWLLDQGVISQYRYKDFFVGIAEQLKALGQ